MSVIISKSSNRLAKLLRKPGGGLTVMKALSAARANLDSIRDDCLASIDAILDEMAETFRAGRGLEDAPSLYSQSNLIVGFAGSMEMSALSQAAYSLCDMLDRMMTMKRWSSAPVEVHLAAMSRLRQADGDDDICREIIDGLRRVAAQTVQD
jgi:hypothetical protein